MPWCVIPPASPRLPAQRRTSLEPAQPVARQNVPVARLVVRSRCRASGTLDDDDAALRRAQFFCSAMSGATDYLAAPQCPGERCFLGCHPSLTMTTSCRSS